MPKNRDPLPARLSQRGEVPPVADPSFFSRLGRLSSIIMILPGSMAGGWLLGYYVLDRYLTKFPWGSLILTFVGAGAGFWEIVKLLIVDQRSDRERTEGNDS